MSITIDYDRHPEKVVDEKEVLLDYLVANKGRFVASKILNEIARIE